MGLDRDEQQIYSAAYDWWSRWGSRQAARVSAAWAEALRVDPLLRSARVVVDLSLGGGQVRVLVGPAFAVAAAGRAGGPRRVHGELLSEPVFSESIEPGQGGLERRSVSVSVSGRLIAPAAVLATGRPLAGHGEVSLLADGMGWDDRLVWLRGPVSKGVTFGRDDEIVDLTISDPSLAGRVVPPWVLDVERWPNLPETSVGERVPIVIGDVILPCLRVNSTDEGGDDRFLVAHGHGGLQLTTAWVRAGDETRAVVDASGALIETEDAEHLPVTLVEFAGGPASVVAEIDVEVFVAVMSSDDDLLGLTLLEAVRRLLRDYDPGRESPRLFSEAAARVAQAGAAGGSYPGLAINDSAGLYDYVGNDVFSDHPYLSLAWDGAQVGPIAVDHRAPPVASLRPGVYPVLGRVDGGRYEESPTDDLRTSFVIRYDYTPVSDVWRGAQTRNPGNNALCAAAAALLEGEQVAEDIEALSIRDDASAAYVLDWLCEHFARVSYTVEVECYPVAWFLLRLGDTVRWTDPDVGWEDVQAIVVGRTRDRVGVVITLRIYPSSRTGGGSRSF